MPPILLAAAASFGLFLGMLAALEAGRRAGRRRLARDPQGLRHGLGAVEGAVFGLLGLLVAFTFSGAAGRFDERRNLIVQEANDIGTAWLRIDLAPTAAQPELRESFRRYLDERIAAYAALPDRAKADAHSARAVALQGEIWKQAVAACAATTDTRSAMLLLPAINQMVDVTTTRVMTAIGHPPPIVYVMLCIVALVSAFLAGYGMAESKLRNHLHSFAFAAILGVTLYVIVEIEYPRAGLVRIDDFDQVLVALRASMGGA